jgi:hypothetical protein
LRLFVHVRSRKYGTWVSLMSQHQR